MEEQGCSFGRAPAVKVYVAALSDEARSAAQVLTHRLRRHGVAAEQDTASRGFKAQMKSADASHAAWTCIIGPEEMEKGLVTVRNMADGSQTSLAPEAVPEFVAKDGK